MNQKNSEQREQLIKQYTSGLTRKDCILNQKETVFKGFFSLEKHTLSYKTFAGNTIGPIQREIFERGNAAAIIPYDPIKDEVVLIEQFRPGCFVSDEETPWDIEIVAGIIDKGENSKDTVIREAKEEANLDIDCSSTFQISTFFPSPGACTERIDLFLGKVDSSLAKGIHGLAQESEDIRVFCVSLKDALKMCDEMIIRNAITIISLQYIALHKEEILKRWNIKNS